MRNSHCAVSTGFSMQSVCAASIIMMRRPGSSTIGPRATGVATLPGPLDIPPWESGSPFRLFLHWAYAAAHMRLTHAATLGLDGYGALIVGAERFGKIRHRACRFPERARQCRRRLRAGRARASRGRPLGPRRVQAGSGGTSSRRRGARRVRSRRTQLAWQGRVRGGEAFPQGPRRPDGDRCPAHPGGRATAAHLDRARHIPRRRPSPWRPRACSSFPVTPPRASAFLPAWSAGSRPSA